MHSRSTFSLFCLSANPLGNTACIKVTTADFTCCIIANLKLYLFAKGVLQVCECVHGTCGQRAGVVERDAHKRTFLHQGTLSREAVSLHPHPAHGHAARNAALQNRVTNLLEVLAELVLTERRLDLTGRAAGDQRAAVLLLQILNLQQDKERERENVTACQNEDIIYPSSFTTQRLFTYSFSLLPWKHAWSPTFINSKLILANTPPCSSMWAFLLSSNSNEVDN